MSRFLRYEPCPKCQSVGRDNRGDNCGVYSDGSKHCYACGWHQFPSHHIRKTIEENRTENKALLPNDFTRDIPTTAIKWLLQWGLPYSYWKEAIGYSPKEGRLIFRIGETSLVEGRLERTSESLAFSIGRQIEQQTLPEGKKVRKWFVWGDAHKHAEIIGDGNTIVLVEDLLSAHKVANAGYQAIPLFGTNISKPVLYYLLNTNKNIILWLDKDQELNVKKQAAGLSLLLSRPVKITITDKDPKALSFTTINEVLNG